MVLVEEDKEDFVQSGKYRDKYRNHCNGVLWWKEKLSSISNITQTSRDLEPRTWVEISGWKITKQKHQRWEEILAKPT